MNITWITGRDLDVDLASTTEVGLIGAINNKKNIVRVMSPTENIDNYNFEHIKFNKIRFRGLETFSAGFSLNNKFKGNKLIQEFSLKVRICFHRSYWRTCSL